MFVIIESTFFLFFGFGLIATHVAMSLHIASGIEVKSGGIMSVYCLHEWNFKHDSLAELHYVVWSCLELLFTKKEKQWSSQMKLLGSFLAKRFPQNNCDRFTC